MPLPTVPDRFQALEELARGETGVLVRVRDRVLQREVVLKLPPEGARANSAEERERELREARALARVQHRGIVRLLDVIESPAGPLLVLEPSSGESLSEMLAREQRLEPEFVRALALELAGALAAVHAVGVVHRGIALDQILLRSDKTIVLGGFGFAKFSGPASSIPGTTYLYARDARPAATLPPHPAPEQIAGQAADARSDIFGLGWVLYECLTGEQPYPIELEVEHWRTPRNPRALVPGTPKDLSDAVLRCLAISPAKRYGSAEELRAALLRAPAGVPAAAPARSRKPLLAGAGALVLLLAGFLVWRTTQSRGMQERGKPVPTEADRNFAGPPYATLRAVVIGIDKYEHWPQLNCAVADANSVAKLLEEKYGFDPANVVTLTDDKATKDAIQKELAGEMADRAGKEDAVLVYFAGHGQTEELPREGHGHRGYLVPVGGETERSSNMASLIPMSDVTLWAQGIRAKHVFFVLDACFSGLATSRNLSTEDSQYVAFLAREPSQLVLTAGGKDQTVIEDPTLGHSIFTDRLLAGLGEGRADTDHNGVITAGELWIYLQPEVSRATSGKQRPQFARIGDGEGEFLFLDAAAREKLKLK